MELNEKWVSVTLRAQSELCATVSGDCSIKVVQCEQLIDSLLIDIAQIIPQRGQELHSSYKGIVGGLHVKIILSRNSSKTKNMKCQPTDLPTRVPSTIKYPPNNKRNQRAQTRQVVNRQLQELTLSIQRMK